MRNLYISLVLCVSLLGYVIGQTSNQNVCAEQKTCGACVAAGGECGWCTQEGYDDNGRERCDLVKNLVPNGCDDTFIIRPDHNMTVVRNLEVRNAQGGQEAVQLAPQEIHVKLRPNKPHTFSLTFRQAENYPVDLYYVMDLSYSMNDDKSKLAELGDLLAQGMSEITKNFRLGFGSFVDKKTMPYVSTVPEKLQVPCEDKQTGVKCAAPYGFRNQLPLTDDTAKFKTEVLAAPISGNLDAPEGGFDAIMQSVACQDEIGWREQSRKMLMYSTDAAFHYAGDGKLGGIVTPCDGHCHLDNQRYYSESLNQDYPSISQIASKISEKKVNVIFAVTQNRVGMYEKLSTRIEGSSVGELANDSSNIVELVKDNYNKISSTVELKAENAENVNVQFRSRCFGSEMRDTAKCDGLGIGENVTFEVSIEVTECPKNKDDWKQTFEIYPVGLTEKLVVNLDLICECDCEGPTVESPNSPRCNSSGTFECGACTCNPGRYGKNCECDGSNLNTQDYDAACRSSNDSDVCEGRGQCVCGQCNCFPLTPGDLTKKYSGSFCQCDDYSCDYYEGELCGGPSRGKCECGTCKCNPGFNGSACDCQISQEPCRAKSSDLICNDKGVCNCGKCTCNRDTYYRGPTCEDCPTCPGKCEQNKACVQCKAFSSGEYTEEYCNANCSHIELVDKAEENRDKKKCQFRDDDDCIFYFTYEYNSNKVEAQRTKECPSPVNVLAIVLGIVLGIVLIGLLLLCLWKILTVIHDRREYAKFEQERERARWDAGENPIYKEATSTFKNPTYAGKN